MVHLGHSGLQHLLSNGHTYLYERVWKWLNIKNLCDCNFKQFGAHSSGHSSVAVDAAATMGVNRSF